MTDVADQKISMPLGLRIKLSAMMFLQFMTLPVWFNTIIPYVKTLPGGESWTLWCGMFIGFGTLASPLIGMFADRFLNAEKVLALTHLVYAALLTACFFVRSPALLFTLLLLACFVNMPGWSLTATIAMTHSTPAAFPHIRVFGSLGWVASAVFSVIGIRLFGITDFDTSPWIFAGAAATALVTAGLAFALPATPPKARGTPMSVVDAFGLKAFTLFKDPRFLAFGLLLAGSMIPFQWYMNYNALYLKESGFTYLTLTQNLGQVGELAFMVALPFILKLCGYKWQRETRMSRTRLLRYPRPWLGLRVHHRQRADVRHGSGAARTAQPGAGPNDDAHRQRRRVPLGDPLRPRPCRKRQTRRHARLGHALPARLRHLRPARDPHGDLLQARSPRALTGATGFLPAFLAPLLHPTAQ